jgi:alkylation response protein AidB-like acyl-CoA dehydrogenase
MRVFIRSGTAFAGETLDRCGLTMDTLLDPSLHPSSSFEEAEKLASIFREQAPALDKAGSATKAGLRPLLNSTLVRFAPELSERPATTLLRILTTIGSGDLSIGRLFEGHVNAWLLLNRFAGSPLRRHCAAKVRVGNLLGVWCADAPEPLRLVPLGDGFAFKGGKAFASGAGILSDALVIAYLPDGQRQMILVPLEGNERADPASWRPLGMRASTSLVVDFAGVEVNQDQFVGAPGAYFEEPWFTGGCIRFAAVQLGGALAIGRLAHAHLRQTGRNADPYQRHRVARLWGAIHGAQLQLGCAAEAWDAANAGTCPADEILLLANSARHAVEEAAATVIDLAVKAVGLPGLLAPHPLERLVRDLTTYLRQPNPDTALASVGQRILDRDTLPW